MTIEEILELKLPESQTLEYKDYTFEEGNFARLQDKNRMQLAKEICAFSNANGGKIIIGISEDDDSNPAEIKDVGVHEVTFETWEQSFRQYMTAKIKPIVHGLECELITYEGNNLVVISVPESIIKPHAFNDGNKDSFHIRYGNMINDMRLDDLRLAFQEKNIVENKLLRFRDERLSDIYSGDIAGQLGNKSVLVLHIIPEWSMKLNSYVDLRKFESNQLLDVFSPTSNGTSNLRRGTSSYNADGLLINYGYGDMPIMSYTQVFHNASIETIEVRMMNFSERTQSDENQKEYIFNWHNLEKILVGRVMDFIEILDNNEIPKPYYIFATLLNVKGKQALFSYDVYPEVPITKDIVKSVPAFITDDETLSKALHPMITSLAHVFGFEYSSLYTREGEPVSDIFDDAMSVQL